MIKEDVTQYCKSCLELSEELEKLKLENRDLKFELALANKKVENLTEMYLDMKRRYDEINH